MSDTPKLNREDMAARANQVAVARARYYCNLISTQSFVFEKGGNDQRSLLDRLRIEWHNIMDAHRWVTEESITNPIATELGSVLLKVPVSVLNLLQTPLQNIDWFEALLDVTPACPYQKLYPAVSWHCRNAHCVTES